MTRTFWFNKKVNGVKKYCSKSITFSWHWQHWKIFYVKTNGALKGRIEDACYDFNLCLGCFHFSYTNWDYNFNPSKQ